MASVVDLTSTKLEFESPSLSWDEVDVTLNHALGYGLSQGLRCIARGVLQDVVVARSLSGYVDAFSLQYMEGPKTVDRVIHVVSVYHPDAPAVAGFRVTDVCGDVECKFREPIGIRSGEEATYRLRLSDRRLSVEVDLGTIQLHLDLAGPLDSFKLPEAGGDND